MAAARRLLRPLKIGADERTLENSAAAVWPSAFPLPSADTPSRVPLDRSNGQPEKASLKDWFLPMAGDLHDLSGIPSAALQPGWPGWCGRGGWHSFAELGIAFHCDCSQNQ